MQPHLPRGRYATYPGDGFVLDLALNLTGAQTRPGLTTAGDLSCALLCGGLSVEGSPEKKCLSFDRTVIANDNFDVSYKIIQSMVALVSLSFFFWSVDPCQTGNMS